MLHIMAVVHQDDGFKIGRVATSTIKKPCIILPAAAVGRWKKPGRQGAPRMWGARHAAKVKTLLLFKQGHAEQALQSFCAKSG